MTDIISLSGARVLFKNTEKCLYEINKDGFIPLEFIGESAEDNSSNFSSIFQALESCDIQTFFYKRNGSCEHLIYPSHAFSVFPKISGIANQTMTSTFGLRYGIKLTSAITDWYFRSATLSDPMITTDHIAAFKIISERDVTLIKEAAHKTFNFLNGFFTAKGFKLGSLTLKFGQNDAGEIVVCEEIKYSDLELWSISDYKQIELSPNYLRRILT